MAKRVIVNIAQKKIKVVPTSVNAGTGETLIGTIDHYDGGNNDAEGYKGSHVLYHHIEKLMIKAKLFDYPSYSIFNSVAISGVNAGNDFSVTAGAGANHTHQMAPAVLPEDTTESKAVTYVSSVPAKATVSNTGLVTGVAAGTTVITVTAVGGATDTVTVTVT
jgi:uncharacterized protein YjdB